jgi:type I restriction-modification system DNA methylase subunit/polyhydroxyalkanoate synthesis regulator phasin
MSSNEDFISKVCNAFKKAVESVSGATLEGREEEFKRTLARHLFDETLGWGDHSKVGVIYDITCFDDENFPIIDIETKWGVEPTHEIKEKLRKRIEELGSVRYGVFASERDFIIYEYSDYKLKDVTKINVAEAIGVARGDYGLSEEGKKRILKLEILRRERLVWIEESDYFEKTYKEISVAKGEGVKLLTENLKDIVRDLTTVLMNFLDSYSKRTDYSGKFLQNTFNDWLKLSMKDEEFEKGDEKRKQKIIEIFCRETAYVLVGKILFIRICEDKDVFEPSLSGKGLSEFLKFYEKRKRENIYLLSFDESREEIKKYYTHLHELGFFDWWIVEEVMKGTFSNDERKIQDSLEKSLDYSIKKCLRRLNRFDFTEVNRDILGDVYQGYLPPDERKHLGEFYTPKEVVEYILDAVDYKSDNEIRGKKILDPACGSGSFLVEATQRLIERYRKIRFNLKSPDDARQVIDDCISSTYGLDIHPFACFIAEMNLLFQLVDLYHIVRQKDKYYELPRLHIYRTDSLVPPSEVTIEIKDFMENSRRKMLIEETKGANRIKNVKFDFVIGNPPYVRKERISTEYKEKVLTKAYSEVYHGDNDLYVYFIARGINQLKEDGTLGYIVSSKFLKTRYGANLRDFVLNSCCIKQFLDFGLIDVFRDVANLPVILVLRKEAEEKYRIANKVKVVIAKQEKGYAKDLMKYVKENIGKETYSDDFIDVFDVKQSSLGRNVWKLVPVYHSEIFEKIKWNSDFLLGKICDVYYCIKTGLNKVDKNGVLVVTEKEVNELNLEKVLLRPVLRGENVRKFKIDYKNQYLVFPYIKEETDGQYKVVDIEKYPNLYQHLSRFKERLAKRTDIRETGNRWYELRPCNYYHIFESEKIITPDLSKRNNFTYDDGKYFCLDSCFVIVINDEYKKELKEKFRPFLKYLLGLLNSKVLEFYFKQISTFVLARHYRYKVEYLEPLPVKTITDVNRILIDELTNKVEQILHLNYESSRLAQKLREFPSSYFENWSFDKLSSIIKRKNLSRESYAISEKLLRTDYKQRDLLDSTETFKIILATGEFIDFDSEEVASYVFEMLKKMNRITRRELLELKIPRQLYLKNLMNQYRKDKEQIVKNEKAVEELEKQIDDLVYKLYDITYAERRIIEDYLKKF